MFIVVLVYFILQGRQMMRMLVTKMIQNSYRPRATQGAYLCGFTNAFLDLKITVEGTLFGFLSSCYFKTDNNALLNALLARWDEHLEGLWIFDEFFLCRMEDVSVIMQLPRNG